MKAILCLVMLLALTVCAGAQVVIIDTTGDMKIRHGINGKPDTIVVSNLYEQFGFMNPVIEYEDSLIIPGDITVTEEQIKRFAKDSLMADVTKVLELAVKYLQPKNEVDREFRSFCYPVGTVDSVYYPPTPAQKLREEARCLEREAAGLEQYDKDVAFIRETLKRWRAR